MTTPSPDLPTSLADPDLGGGYLVGEYRVEGILGRGAFGTVYKASQPLIGKDVAIKVLARRFSVDPEMVSRFIAEARAVNQIRNRNIIDIFSFGQLDDGRHYYVMEFLDGETLDVTLAREHRLGLGDALPILRAIGRALDAAHGKGIAHRDLKAENVFVARDDDGSPFPKLLDFGIAKLLAPIDDGLKHKTRTGTPVGTPYYMSPEQCKGRDVDHRTDLYALGVLAYRLLVGDYPFDADDAMSIMIKQLTDHPAPPSTIVGELPPGVDDAIAWLMAKDPADRPPCARDAVRALEQAAEQAGISIGVPSAAWDAQSAEGRAYATQPPNTRSRVASGARARLPSGATTSVARGSRRWVLALAAVAAIGIAAAVFFALRPDGESNQALAPGTAIVPTVGSTGIAPTGTAPTQLSPASPATPMVIVTIAAGVPEGTEVSVAGVTVGAAPGPVQLPRGDVPVVLTFKVDGYLPQSRTVTPDRDQQLAVLLKKKPVAGPGPKRPGKDDILDPFGTTP